MSLSALAAVPLLASLVLSYRADPGTVYVAADSRLTAPVASLSAPPDDSACKIRVLSGGVVFVGTGNAIFSVQRVETNIYAIAARAARTLPARPLTAPDVRRMALAWQATVRARLAAKLASERFRQTSMEDAVDATGTTGSFYAATAEGGVYGITLRVALGENGLLTSIEEPQPQTGYLVATGGNEAKQQALQLAASPLDAALPWPRRLQAVEAQAIRSEALRYGVRSTIGGPIDLIEITPKGPAWLARKNGCR